MSAGPPAGMQSESLDDKTCHCGCHEPDGHQRCSTCGQCRGHDSKPDSGRNLVVCIDGTSNKFSSDLKLSNVIKLYRLAEKSDQQLTYYNSGIGTYARPETFSPRNLALPVYHKIEQAFGLHLEYIVNDAYRWISDNYKEGDRIFLFGFSRGAYQVRLLSAMINRVGLIHRGNTKQIPFAYELYTSLKDTLNDTWKDVLNEMKSVLTTKELPHEEPLKGDADSNPVPNIDSVVDTIFSGEVGNPPCRNVVDSDEKLPRSPKQQSPKSQEEEEEAEHVFKDAFCRKVNVHFVGAWDTVSSIGFARGESHPDTTSGMSHVCYFRHALALDERRVKFLPEYVCGGASLSTQGVCTHEGAPIHPHTKEVWFPGTHSDIGGLPDENSDNQKMSPPLAWMYMEAGLMGLRFDKPKPELSRSITITKSLTPLWWPVECLPLKRLSYGPAGEANRKTSHWPHRGRGRKVLPGQLIHESIRDQKTRNNTEYTPRACGYDNLNWEELIGSPDKFDQRIEPWGAIGDVHQLLTTDEKDQVTLLKKMREDAGTETGKHRLLLAGVFYALKAPPLREGKLHPEDLDAIHVIFDEVYDGRIPEKLDYKWFKPFLSDILSDINHESFGAARRFLTDFTNFAPVTICVFHKGHHPSPVVFASFWRKDPDLIIAASEDGRIRVWNVRSQRKVFGFRQHESIKSFACSSDGKHAVSVSHNGKIHLWDAYERKLLWRGLIPKGSAGPVKFTEQGELIISAIENQQLLTWETKLNDQNPSKDLEDRLTGNQPPREHNVNDEGQHLLDVSHLDLLSPSGKQLWDEYTFKDIRGVAVSNDASRAVIGTAEGIKVYQWNMEKWDQMSTIPVPNGSLRSLAFSPDGKNLIAGGRDSLIRIWDTSEWYEKIAFPGHDSRVNAVIVSEDNRRIVSCSEDGTVRVWDAENLLQGPHLHEVDTDNTASLVETEGS